MKADKEGLVRKDDGSLACDCTDPKEGSDTLEREAELADLRDLGNGEVGFSHEEANFFSGIVQEQIKASERKKGAKGRAKAKRLVEEVVEDGEEGNDLS